MSNESTIKEPQSEGRGEPPGGRQRRKLDQQGSTGISAVYPIARGNLPETELTQGDYVVRFARSPQELEQILRLRFEVFNLELGEGLDESYLSGRDEDPFDAVCHHAVVLSRQEQRPVGTIRLQTSEMARNNLGFYSETEFDLRPLPEEILHNSMEIGRACVLRSHRNKRVLFLLWKALALYLSFNRQRRLFGCCSLNSQDPQVGHLALRYFRREGHIHPSFQVKPKEGFECPPCEDVEPVEQLEIPTLFRTYLRYNAKVCSGPAVDAAFKTIDFFVLLDIADLNREKYRLFFQ
ncbi:MAG TPA: GNAT family N-acyltransferase [Acidobacteriota bacterium]|nr:GNAT family N-acyltransferase [Acidobacteriota bacterium]